MWPEHGDMVGDRLGVRRPDADVDHGDAAIVWLLQMIRRHLWQTQCRRDDVRPLFAGLDDDVARLDEFGIAATAYCHQAPGARAELVDIELVVGEQYEVLKVVWAGGRVVLQAMQRIVDALRGELRQRPRLADQRLVCA